MQESEDKEEDSVCVCDRKGLKKNRDLDGNEEEEKTDVSD